MRTFAREKHCKLDHLLTQLATRSSGLTAEAAAGRLVEHGPTVLAKDQRPGMHRLLWRAAINPLVLLLTELACISFATGDVRAGFVLSLMIVLAVWLKLVQKARADSAAAKLWALISVTATVIRDGQPQEVPVSRLVPGDAGQLAKGDMIAIPSSPLGGYLGFTSLPALCWPLLALTLLSYVVLNQLVKTWLLRMKWI